MDRTEQLIKLLNVCPDCVSGFLRPPEFTKKQLSGTASWPPSFETQNDTKTKSVTVSCSNGLCSKEITFENPFYVEKTPDNALNEDQNVGILDEYDLFGY
jgi:hypothetical protein